MGSTVKRKSMISDAEITYDKIKEFINLKLVEDIKMLAEFYSGGRYNKEIENMVNWLISFLSDEDQKKILSAKTKGGLRHDSPSGFESFANSMNSMLKNIIGVGFVGIDGTIISGGDGFKIIEGKRGVTEKIKELDMKVEYQGMRSQSGNSAFMFSKDNTFYVVSQYTCDGCDELHLRMYVVDNEKSNKAQEIIKKLQKRYETDLISA